MTDRDEPEAAVRPLVITQNVTLDGSVEMLGEWFDPQGQGDQSDLLDAMAEQDARADGFLCGRRTFTDLRGYWRDLEGDATGVTDYLNAVSKYVVSSTLGDPDWDRTTVLSGDPVAEVAALKATEGREIVLTGSIMLAHALIGAGLVDEYRHYLFPVVQGRGRRLFPDGYEVPRMETLEVRPFRSGITLLRHRPVPGGAG